MKVHLFGLPKSAHIRLRNESREWSDAVPEPHDFRSTPILSNELGQVSKSEIDELAKAVGEGFNHIVLAGVREWKKVYSHLRLTAEFTSRGCAKPIRDLGWPLLRQQLRAVVSMDELWLRKLSPTDLRHALLLPPMVFATNHDTADFWQRCDVYAQELFGSAEQLLGYIEKHHRRPDERGGRSWLDSRNRRYRFDATRHGRSPADRAGVKSYRFCFEIPPGFHYDVCDDSGRTFTIAIDGCSQTVTHCNVTPWGKVRPG